MQNGVNKIIMPVNNMQRFDQINVIPFIDIMLVLLAIVLTTATFISQGLIEINLPVAESANKATPSQEQKLIITIDENNLLYLADELVDFDRLNQTLQTTSKQTLIVFRVDKQVLFSQFVQVIDLLKANQLDKFSIVTVDRS